MTLELKAYLNILWQERAIVLLCTIATLIAAYVFTSNQPVIYEATASFVMRPRAALLEDQEDSVRVLDTLGRQVSIGSTYVEVASSRLIRQRAGDNLSLSSDERSNLKVSGQAVAGTNILKISVQGTDPTTVYQYANQIGVETVEYVSNLYEIFELEPLDAAKQPRNPIKPTLILNLILGGMLGAVLGTGIALFNHYWRTPYAHAEHFDIIDPETGIYNVAYFRLRLHQEVSRARRKGETLSIALIRISRGYTNASAEMVLRSATYLKTELRDDDLLAYAGEGTFAILLLDMSGEAAQKQIEALCNRLYGDVLMAAEGAKMWGAKYAAGISSFKDSMTDADDLWTQSVQVLTDVRQTRNGRVRLYAQPESVMASSQPLPSKNTG